MLLQSEAIFKHNCLCLRMKQLESNSNPLHTCKWGKKLHHLLQARGSQTLSWCKLMSLFLFP